MSILVDLLIRVASCEDTHDSASIWSIIEYLAARAEDSADWSVVAGWLTRLVAFGSPSSSRLAQSYSNRASDRVVCYPLSRSRSSVVCVCAYVGVPCETYHVVRPWALCFGCVDSYEAWKLREWVQRRYFELSRSPGAAILNCRPLIVLRSRRNWTVESRSPDALLNHKLFVKTHRPIDVRHDPCNCAPFRAVMQNHRSFKWSSTVKLSSKFVAVLEARSRPRNPLPHKRTTARSSEWKIR